MRLTYRDIAIGTATSALKGAAVILALNILVMLFAKAI